MGNVDGGSVLCQSAVTMPFSVSCSVTVPALATASSGLPRSAVVHASVNVDPFVSLTVTFSVVGVLL
jgi:hypothetical protein